MKHSFLTLAAVATGAISSPAQAPIIEPHSGISFPASLSPPGGGTEQWLTGAGIRELTVFIVGLYVDRQAARATLAGYASRPAESPMEDAAFYRRLLDLQFAMSLRLVLARDIAGADIGKAFDEALRPRLAQQGAAAGQAGHALQQFRGYFEVGQLATGTEIIFSCSPEGRPVTALAGTPHRSLDSRPLCEALFDVYLGTKPISESGRRAVIAGFPEVLTG